MKSRVRTPAEKGGRGRYSSGQITEGDVMDNSLLFHLKPFQKFRRKISFSELFIHH